MKSTLTKLTLAPILAILLSPIVANASVLVDRSFDPLNNIIGTLISSPEGVAELADDFTLNSAATITDITFWGGYWSNGSIPAVEDIRVVIDQRIGTARGANLYDLPFIFTRTDTGLDHNNNGSSDIWAFTGSPTIPISLAAGDYWLSFYLDTNHPTANLIWQRSATTAPIGVYSSPTSYAASYGDFAFRLEDNQVVPEPTSIAIFGIGALGLVAGRVRRRRKQ